LVTSKSRIPLKNIIRKCLSIVSSHDDAASLPNKANNAKLQALKDCHKGRRAIVVGNGPSLLVADLEKLKNEITFASNKIYMVFEETSWRPTYLTVTDTVVAKNNIEYLRDSKLCKIFGHGTFRRFFPWPDTDNQYTFFHGLECFDCTWECIFQDRVCLSLV